MKIHLAPPPKTKQSYVGFDLELFDLAPRRIHRPPGTLACAAFAVSPTEVYVVDTVDDLKRGLDNVAHSGLVIHNALFDLSHLRYLTGMGERPVWDTLLVDRILWNGYYRNFGLSDLARRYLGLVLHKDLRELFIKSKNPQLTHAMRRYNAQDAAAALGSAYCQAEVLEFVPEAWPIYRDLDYPCIWAVLDMPGLYLNKDGWMKLAEAAEAEKVQIRSKLSFNPASSPQTVSALSKHLGVRLSDSSEPTLLEYEDDPLVQDVLAYRDAVKRAGTYGANLYNQQVEEDGRWYPSYNITGALTGRMSASGIHQIPHQTAYRACFTVPKGHVFISADFEQQEPRVLAQLSGDENLREIFKLGLDVHLQVARAIYEDDSITHSDEKRRTGKTYNLAISYGMTINGLSRKTGLPKNFCSQLLDNYFRRFPGVKLYIHDYRALAQKQEFVTTISGRRIWISPYTWKYRNVSINAPVQGTAADIIKRSLILVHKKLPGNKFPITGIVHDEFTAEVRRSDLAKVRRIIVNAMTQAYQEFVPDVSAKNLIGLAVGESWAAKT